MRQIDAAEKNPKEVTRWITSVEDLHRSKPPHTVMYTKQMPEFDELMKEWQPEMEEALKRIEFPGADIDMHAGDYSRLIFSMLDIPCHKLAKAAQQRLTWQVMF